MVKVEAWFADQGENRPLLQSGPSAEAFPLSLRLTLTPSAPLALSIMAPSLSDSASSLDEFIQTQCSRTDQQTHIYDYPWELVVASYMIRYPRHPLVPVLLNAELVEDSVDEATQKRILTRRCSINIEAPMYLIHAFSISTVCSRL